MEMWRETIERWRERETSRVVIFSVFALPPLPGVSNFTAPATKFSLSEYTTQRSPRYYT